MADEIRTERLLLRRVTMADLDAIHAVLSNPEAMRFWSTPPHQDIGESETWLRSMVYADRSVSDDFIVEYQGRALGKVGCWRLPEVGFILAPDCWGKGIASEALQAYLEHRRAIGAPAVISADVDPRNVRSLALLARNGFVETSRASRTWHVGDEWCDSVYLALKL